MVLRTILEYRLMKVDNLKGKKIRGHGVDVTRISSTNML